MRVAFTIGALIILLFTFGCAGEMVPNTSTAQEADWNEFGLPMKGDDPGCSQDGVICWNESEASAFRGVLAAEDALILGTTDPHGAAYDLIDGLSQLRHKLSPQQSAALDELAAEATPVLNTVGEDAVVYWIDDLRQRVSAGLHEGYFASHSVVLGHLSQAGAKYDEVAAEEPQGSGRHLNADMLASLAQLKQTGAMGQAYAFLLQHSGVLERDYPILDESFPYSEPIEDKAHRLIAQARWATARLKLLTNLESLVPFVGLALSVPHDIIGNFRIRARLILELVSLYGLNIREGQNLLLATHVLLASMDILETQLLVASAMVIPIAVITTIRVTGAVLPQRLLAAVTLKALSGALAALSLKGEALLTRAAARASARAVGRQVLGYATLGIAIIADISIATAATSRIGTHAMALSRPWGSSALEVGSSLLRDDEASRCVARTLGHAVRVDGSIAEDEALFLAGHLDRPVFITDVWTQPSSGLKDEWLRALEQRDEDGCVDSILATFPASDRRTLVGWYATTVSVDGEITLTEREALDGFIRRIDGGDIIGDGLGLREDDVHAIVAQVETLLTHAGPVAEAMTEEEIPRLTPRQLIWGLDDVSVATIEAVRCALGSRCP